MQILKQTEAVAEAAICLEKELEAYDKSHYSFLQMETDNCVEK